MLIEVKAAVNFLGKLMQSSGQLSKECLESFKNTLETKLHTHYEGHWFPEKPIKGSAYRCIRINHVMDPLLASAARDSGIANLLKYFPNEFTLWVDPYDVSYRFGENGSIGQIYGADDDIPSSQSQNDLTYSPPTMQSTKSSYLGVLSTCKEQLREFASSNHRSAVFTPFAAFVSS